MFSKGKPIRPFQYNLGINKGGGNERTPPLKYMVWLYGNPVAGIPTAQRVGTLSAFQIVETNKLIATDPLIIQGVTVSTDLGPLGRADYDSMQNGKPKYVNTSNNVTIYWDSGSISWIATGSVGLWQHAGDTPLPPITGWTKVSGPFSSITIGHDDPWVDVDGNFVSMTKAEILAFNLDTYATRSSYNDSGDIVDIVIYGKLPDISSVSALNSFLDSRHS